MKNTVLKYIYKRLWSVAQQVVDFHEPKVIAITGSVGKTSTKEALAAVFKLAYGDKVRYTHGNLNAEIGIPLTILGYTRQPKKIEWPIFLAKVQKHLKEESFPEFLILEMGVERPGDIQQFCQIARPDVAVITAATPAHISNFPDLHTMQSEKASLSNQVKDSGYTIYNADDDFLSKSINGQKFSYGFDQNAFCRAEQVKVGLHGNRYTIVCGDHRIRIESPLIGKQMIYSELAAAAVAIKFNIDSNVIKSALESRKPFPGRLNMLQGKNNTTIIDDTYNANPASVKAAADLLAEIDHPGRRVLILGNMNELGALDQEQHLEVAKYLSGKADLIILAGPNAEPMKKEITKSQVFAFANRLEVADNLWDIVKSGDLVLLKASQNRNYFEELVKILMDEKYQADDVLVRQDEMWNGKKNQVYKSNR